MGARKTIDLGGGVYRAVSYDELKTRLKKEGADSSLATQVLRKNFPDDFAAEQKSVRAEQEAANAAQLRKIKERRWNSYLGDSSLTPSPSSHQEVVARVSAPGSHRRCDGPHNRVTDFSNWIYEAMPYARSGRENREAGKTGEREVARLKRMLRAISDGHSDWKLIDRDPLDEKPKAREISLLRIGDSSLFGAPDYVYHNPKQDSILIVEVKVSNPQLLPADGWPNLRAQLWAYGNIDFYVGLARNIILVGEIWRKTYSVHTRKEGYKPLFTYRWGMSDTVFCKQNEQLFDIYKTWISTSGCEGS